jgi:uncharacterized protein YfdQ (DUF2303 family)
MSIMKTSILFSRGGTVYNQLRVVALHSHEDEKKSDFYAMLLRTMDAIYKSENTRANRMRLNDFIKDNALRIATEYAHILESSGNTSESDIYSLKED